MSNYIGVDLNYGSCGNMDTFSGTGSTDTFTLSQIVPSSSGILVAIDGVLQKAGAGFDYTAQESTLTFNAGSIPGVGTNNIAVHYLGKKVDIGVPTAVTAEVYGFDKYFQASTLVKTVTVSASKYYIDGVLQDTLDLYEGNTYIFDYPSAHPFKFSITSDGTHGSGSEYTTGVTHNSSTQVTIVVASGAPTLYYYCSAHASMGGTANTPVPADNALRVVTTNKGADNIDSTTYANFDEVVVAASGITWSLSGSDLIATI